MKKTSYFFIAAAIALCSILALAAAPVAAAQSAEPADMKPSSTESGSLQQQVVAAERQGLDALKAGNVDLFANHTADEAVFVDARGPASKAQVVKNVADFRLTDYSMDDVQFLPLSPTSGLIVYKITEKGVSHGREFAAQAYISSIWTERAGKWVCLFSQETGAR
jgi:Domain of unknown function (DUF4440)